MYDDPLHVAFFRTNQWMQAVELQVDRIIGPTLDPVIDGETKYRNNWNQRQRDIDYFLIALYRLKRGVDTVNNLLKSIEINNALIAFNRVAPDLKDLRDIGEHMDAYDWGKGNLEEQLTNEAPTYSYGPTDGGISYRGKSLTIIQSLAAARKLHQVVMDVLSKSGKEIDLAEWPLVQNQKDYEN